MNPNAFYRRQDSSSEFGGRPLVPGVARGVRSFAVDPYGRLRGVTHAQVWRPGENLARCATEPPPQPTTGSARGSRYDDYRTLMGDSLRSILDVVRIPAGEDGMWDADHPLGECGHGFYAYFDGSNDYYQSNGVSAVVEGYGEAVIGTRGFRAAKARIVALHIPAPDAVSVPPWVLRRVQRNYPDVPVFPTFEAMVTEVEPDHGLAPTPETDPDFWTRQ